VIEFDCVYLAAGFFAGAFFAADLGFAAFFAAAGFLAPVALGFLGVVAFLTFGLTAFFVPVAFFASVDLAAPAFFGLLFGLAALVPEVDLGFVLDFGFADLAIRTFFGFDAVVVVDDDVAAVDVAAVAELLLFAAVATFLTGFDPADLERERFFVPDVDVVDPDGFFVFVDFFFVGLALSFNLNEPLAPLPLVCFNDFDFTPFFKANFKC